MEKTIFGETMTLDSAAIHIAPGGSILCHLVGKSSDLAKLLETLREEIAFGMIDVSTEGETAKADIYFGAADEGDFKSVFSRLGDGISCDASPLDPATSSVALSMSARNLVMERLKRH